MLNEITFNKEDDAVVGVQDNSFNKDFIKQFLTIQLHAPQVERKREKMKKEDADVIFCETPLLAHTGLTGIHKLQQLYLYV